MSHFEIVAVVPGDEIVCAPVNGILNLELTPESRVVLGWLGDPTSYPYEFRGVPLYLYKSIRLVSDDRIEIAYLFWNGDSVSLHYLYKKA